MDPTDGITLDVLGRTVRSKGRNLNGETRRAVRLFNGILGLYGGIDDLFATGGGAVVGVIAQGLSDWVSGERSSWEAYVAAGVGGAITGELSLYAGPVVAGAAGSAAENGLRQGLYNLTGKQHGFDSVSFATETAAGGIGAKLGELGGKLVGKLIKKFAGNSAKVLRQYEIKPGGRAATSQNVKGEIGEFLSYIYNRMKGAEYLAGC